MACTRYVDCDHKNESLDSLIKRIIVQQEDGTLALRTTCCEATPVPPVELPFRMLIDTQANADTMIGGDSSDVADWNTFFDLPTNGTPFDNIALTNVVGGIQIDLFGGANIKLRDYVFGDNDPNGTSLLEVDDQLGCVIECGEGVFSDYGTGGGCYGLTEINLPNCLTLGTYAFVDCEGLTNVSLPLLTNGGISCFSSCENLINISLPSLISGGAAFFDSSYRTETIDLPSLTSAGARFFSACIACESINIPVCTSLGGTTGDDNVFEFMTGLTITITIPHALETDGDIVTLKANNTVTVLYSD